MLHPVQCEVFTTNNSAKNLWMREAPIALANTCTSPAAIKEPNSLLQYRVVSPRPELQIHQAEKGRLLSTERTPYGWLARMESSAENTPRIVTEIHLYENEKKIEFIEDVSKKEVLAKEAVYFAFPFAVSRPQFQYEIQNGVVDPQKTCIPAQDMSGSTCSTGFPWRKTDFRER